MAWYIGIVMIIFLEKFKATALQSNNRLIVFFAYFSSVFFHEAAHFIVSLLLLGKPVWFSVIPKRTSVIKNNKKYFNWLFGNVESGNVHSLNAAPIGLAPLLLLLIGYFVSKYAFDYVKISFIHIIEVDFILFSLISSAIPSTQDIKVAFTGGSFFIYCFAITLIVMILHFINLQGVWNEVESTTNAIVSYV